MVILRDALYENIGKIQHLRTFEFLKVIEQNQEADGISRITYKRWKEKYGIHAFILNCCVEESQKLGLLKVLREGRDGSIKEGSKGIRRVYQLLTEKNDSITKPLSTQKEKPKKKVTTKRVTLSKRWPSVRGKKKSTKK